MASKLKKSWMFSQQYSKDRAQRIEKEMAMTRLASRVLAARGAYDGSSAREWLECDAQNLYDPFLLPDMDKAVKIIRESVAKKEKIAIFGDYDVDGVTSTCVMLKYFRSVDAQCIYYIPDRLNEGYGVSCDALEKLAAQGVRLVVTVDTGITAFEEVEFAHSLGMKIVVTDHHECREEIPAAEAVVNPKRLDSRYPFKELAGVGVAFKLVCALLGPEKLDIAIVLYAALAGLGTIADLMPLVDENRIIAGLGLERLAENPPLGYLALAQKSGVDESKRASAITVSYVLAPRINAAGRFGCAYKSVELFLTETQSEADRLADELCTMNRQRQEMENGIRDSALAKIAAECDIDNDSAVVLWDENWHHGVIGVVSSKLADQLGKPVILICVDGEEGRGSGRSIEGFNLFAALGATSEYLTQFGGHELATGLTLKKENLEAFRTAFLAYAKRELRPDACVPTIYVDCEAEPEDFSVASISSLSALEPFGMANPQPVFCLRDLRVACVVPIGNDRHMRLTLTARDQRFDAVQFCATVYDAPFVKGSYVDIVFNADINTFRGQNVQFILKDVRLSRTSERINARDIDLYRKFMDDAKLTGPQAAYLYPCRSEQVCAWKYIIHKMVDGKFKCPPEDAALRIKTENGIKMNAGKLLVCAAAFAELGFVKFSYDGLVMRVEMIPGHARKDMGQSKLICRLKRAAALV